MTKASFEEHFKKHRELKRKEVKCSECDFVATNGIALSNHLRSGKHGNYKTFAHTVKKEPVKTKTSKTVKKNESLTHLCEECDYETDNKRSLGQHKRHCSSRVSEGNEGDLDDDDTDTDQRTTDCDDESISTISDDDDDNADDYDSNDIHVKASGKEIGAHIQKLFEDWSD